MVYYSFSIYLNVYKKITDRNIDNVKKDVQIGKNISKKVDCFRCIVA